MYGVIDIGANTIRLAIYNINEQGDINEILNKKKVVGLARYIENEIMLEKGIDRAVDTLIELKRIADKNNAELTVFATAPFRNINNLREVLGRIKQETDISVTVLSGEQEAFYDYVAATYNKDISDGVIVDIGGGSTELIFVHEGDIEKAVSIPIGSLNTYTKYISDIFPSVEELKKIKKIITKQLDKIKLEKMDYKVAYGIGGTIRGAMKLHRDMYNIKGQEKELTLKNLKKMLKSYDDDSKAFISEIIDIIPDRVHTLIPGMIILRTIMKYYNSEKIILSDYGIREGFVIGNIINSKLDSETERELEEVVEESRGEALEELDEITEEKIIKKQSIDIDELMDYQERK